MKKHLATMLASIALVTSTHAAALAPILHPWGTLSLRTLRTQETTDRYQEMIRGFVRAATDAGAGNPAHRVALYYSAPTQDDVDEIRTLIEQARNPGARLVVEGRLGHGPDGGPVLRAGTLD